jgi:tRNA1(Val) A37 N6-methylase TrmN6
MDAGSLSTRFTYKHLPLARRALFELSSLSSSKLGDSPAVKLTESCLKLSSEFLRGKSDRLNPLEKQILKVLEGATDGEPGSRRMGLAMATLHFVERTLGLAVQPGRRQNQIRLRMDELRTRSQKCGAYGTPEFISNTMATEVLQTLAKDRARSATILDLSVEAGQFPVTFQHWANGLLPIDFYAVDRDPVALSIAKRIVHFAGSGDEAGQFKLNTTHRDSLIDELPSFWPKQFSVVVGNPPWKQIAGNHARLLQQQFAHWLNMARYDIYLAFIARAHSLVVPGGYLSFVLPSTFLFNGGAAANVRRLLLENYDILNVTLYPQSSFIELSCVIPVSFLARKRLKRARYTALTRITYHSTPLGGSMRPRTSYLLDGGRLWKQLPQCIFHPRANATISFLTKELAGQSLSDWGSLIGGAHLGHKRKGHPPCNFKGIHARHIRAFHACLRDAAEYSAGIARFDRPPDLSWISRNKVVIQEMRYMTHKERLIAAKAGPGACAVSTAMMYFPRDDDYCDFFVALLNSHLANAWYKVRDVSRSIKLTFLREFPVPFDSKHWKHVAELSKECSRIRAGFHRAMPQCTINGEERLLLRKFGIEFDKFLKCRNEIDNVIFDLYCISDNRRKLIRGFSDLRIF